MSWFGWVVLIAGVVAGSVGLGWLVRRRRPAVSEPTPEPVPVPEPAPVIAVVPEEVVAPAPQLPTTRRGGPRVVPAADGRRWVVALTAVAPVAAAALYLHHRRFVRYHDHKGLPSSTAFGTWLRAETLGVGVLSWWYVKGFLRDGLRVPENAVGRPVLCVHGYSQNATNFVGLRQVLESDGRPTVAVSLVHRLAPLSWYAHRLGKRIEAMGREHPEGIDIVAHSMGGVVLRMVLRDHPELRPMVHTVITLGSPHHGTAASRGIPLLPELRALGRRSALLRDLPQLPALLPHGRVVTIAGDTDTIVYPVETSFVEGAEAVVLPGIGHAGLLTAPQSWDAVRRALSA